MVKEFKNILPSLAEQNICCHHRYVLFSLHWETRFSAPRPTPPVLPFSASAHSGKCSLCLSQLLESLSEGNGGGKEKEEMRIQPRSADGTKQGYQVLLMSPE